MLTGWLHTIRFSEYNPEFHRVVALSIDVVWSNQNSPVMFYSDLATAVHGPEPIPSQWQMVACDA